MRLDLGLGALVSGVWSELDQAWERTLDRHLRLAVTGLSRSGKTVFITALVHHLLDGAALPFVTAVHEGRYLGARRRTLRGLEPFPYDAFHAALAAPEPHWPRSTERLSALRLELRFRTTNLLLRQVAAVQTVGVELIDYPGEWLLDLPLLERSYAEFSADALALAERGQRAAAAAEWRAATAAADPDAPADEATAARLAELYTDYLLRCRRELGLSLVQPGRFTNPGDLAGEEVLRFAPLPPGPFRAGSLRARMDERFRAYRDLVVRRFYTDHFSRFDRQIVLVDLLASLNRGPEHFADTTAALAIILESFRYGSRGLLARLLAPRIDRLLFAASKADHVAPSQHAALKQLLERLVTPAMRQARYEGLRPEILALASLRCTDPVRTLHHGQPLTLLRGRLDGDRRETALYTGEVPPEPPSAQDWSAEAFRFVDFAPRRLEPGRPGQHIRLDQAVEFLLGDKLR